MLAVIAAGFHAWMLLSGEPIETGFGSTAVVGLASTVVTLGLTMLAVTSDDLDTVDTCRRGALGTAALSLITTMFGLMVIGGFVTAAWSGHRPRAPRFEPKPRPTPTLPGTRDYLRPVLIPILLLIALGLANVGPAAVYGIYALVALVVLLPDASILYRHCSSASGSRQRSPRLTYLSPSSIRCRMLMPTFSPCSPGSSPGRSSSTSW